MPEQTMAAEAPGATLFGRVRELVSWGRFPLALFAVNRLALFVFSAFSTRLPTDLAFLQEKLPSTYVNHLPGLASLCRWDCQWYESLARDGFREFNTANFWPLYPLLARGVAAITHLQLELALLLCSNVASLIAYLVIFRIFLELEGERAARTALLLFGVYPFAFFQAAGYPESIMILCSALAVMLALRGRHLAAGVALGLGILSRHLTAAFGASLVAAQIRQRGAHPRKLLLHPAILGLVLPLAIGGLYPLFLAHRFGDPMAFVAARTRGWGDSAWWSLWDLFRGRGPNTRNWAYLVFSLLPTAGTAMLAARRRWELAAGAGTLMVIVYAVGLEGLGRYSASCWPAFLPVGLWLSRRPNLEGPVVGALALFQGMFFYLFAHWYPIL